MSAHVVPLSSTLRDDLIDGVLSSSTVLGDNVPRWISSIRHHDAALLLKCRITAMEHRKNEDKSRHEYILLTMQYQGFYRTHARYIRLDRSFDHNPSLVLNHYRTLIRGGTILADDTIIISDQLYLDGSYPLHEVRFDHSRAPTILHLAALLEAITALAPNYHIYKYMCYWHSRMVFDSLTHLFPHYAYEREKAQMRGRFRWSVPVIDRRGGFVIGTKANHAVVPENDELPSLPRILNRYLNITQEMLMTPEQPEEENADQVRF